ncbi:MAG: 50S ribosomal protein L24 [Spirochaetaceae bacterium]|nr:MAG: 50S ribosomal protein L24 [Spirochaetaceae bacterium]
MVKEKKVSTKLKKDDVVKIMKGKDAGKSGRILSVNRENGVVIVEGCNIVKKAMKQRKQNEKGGIKDIEAAIRTANVMIVCKKCGPTRIGYKLSGETKVRVCRKCGEQL